MENFIFSYLTENFYIAKSNVGNWGIYLGPNNLNNENKAFFRAHKLITEISYNFGVSEKQAKKIITKWGSVDLGFYWKVGADLSNLTFPTIRTIAAKTIGVDLVEVKPMSAPLGTLLYLDYSYGTSTTLQSAYDNSTNPQIVTYVDTGTTE